MPTLSALKGAIMGPSRVFRTAKCHMTFDRRFANWNDAEQVVLVVLAPLPQKGRSWRECYQCRGSNHQRNEGRSPQTWRLWTSASISQLHCTYAATPRRFSKGCWMFISSQKSLIESCLFFLLFSFFRFETLVVLQRRWKQHGLLPRLPQWVSVQRAGNKRRYEAPRSQTGLNTVLML